MRILDPRAARESPASRLPCPAFFHGAVPRRARSLQHTTIAASRSHHAYNSAVAACPRQRRIVRNGYDTLQSRYNTFTN
jgi:hypothetical protein